MKLKEYKYDQAGNRVELISAQKISVSPTAKDFGSVNVGRSSTPQAFTISNVGTADLHVLDMALSDTTNYSLNANGGSNPCRNTTPTITPNSSCTVAVTFNPLSTGQKSASLTINSDDPDTPTVSASLTGVGVYTLAILSPNGGEVIPSGSIYSIQWQASPDAVKFDLLYSLNSKTIWNSIASGVTGTNYNWSVPKPLENKKNCFVKVIGYDSSGVKVGEDESDAPFTIEVIRLISPNGGEIWKSGITHAITWQTNATKKPVAKVKLFYTINSGTSWTLIKTLIGNPGSYNWRIPNVSSSSCKVKVVLRNASGTTIGKDLSDNFFTIQP